MSEATRKNISNRPFKAKFPSEACVEAFRNALARKGLDSPFFNIVINRGKNIITMDHNGVSQVTFDTIAPLLRANHAIEVDY